jgi:probable phosphoglycerate mutase
LTEKGIQQAQALRERLAVEPITHAVTSDLGRAKQTMAILLEGRPMVVFETEMLRERHYGKLEGTSEMVWRIQRERLRREKGEELIPEEGESRADVQHRTRSFILEMEALKMGDRLLIVGHSHWNRQFLADILDVPEENWDLLSSSHAGLTALVRDAVDSPWRCLFLDDTSHLSPPQPEPLQPASPTDQPSPPSPQTPPLPRED